MHRSSLPVRDALDSSPAARREIAIEVSHVSKRFKLYDNPILGPLKEHLMFWRRTPPYREFLALDDVSFTVRRGEVVGIIGPNGAGKTTLLKMIAGLLPVTDGRIDVRGSITALLALGVGVNPEFSGRDNILFSGLLIGMSREEITAKTDAIIEFAEIGAFIDQPFRTYSSGMKARLLFAISMSVQPDILIVDEALATGDVAFVRKCERRIRELCESGATILFVSHNMSQVNALCDRSILLMKGKVVAEGTPPEVFEKYRELYIEHESERIAALRKNEILSLTSGTGEISVTEVTLLDGDGKPGNLFFTGGKLTIEVKVRWNTSPPRPVRFFIGFLMGKQYVGHLESENLVTYEGVKHVPVEPTRSVTVHIDQLVMLNGVFSLWIALQDPVSREVMAEYRGVGNFRVAKRHHPFDADAYFAQPVARIAVDEAPRHDASSPAVGGTLR